MMSWDLRKKKGTIAHGMKPRVKRCVDGEMLGASSDMEKTGTRS